MELGISLNLTSEAIPICKFLVEATEVPEYATLARVEYAYHAKVLPIEPAAQAAVNIPNKANVNLAVLNFFIFPFLSYISKATHV